MAGKYRLLKIDIFCDFLNAAISAAAPATERWSTLWSRQRACDRDIPGQRFAGLPQTNSKPVRAFSVYTLESVGLFCCRNINRGKRTSQCMRPTGAARCALVRPTGAARCTLAYKAMKAPGVHHHSTSTDMRNTKIQTQTTTDCNPHCPAEDRMKWSARQTASLRCVQPMHPRQLLIE